MKIELKGVEFSNKGAELMLHSILQQIQRHLPHAEVILTPGYLLPYEKRAVLGTWQKLSFRLLSIDWTFIGYWAPKKLKRLLAHFGIVVEKDIDVVLDASGFVYSDQWEVARLEYCLAHLQRIEKFKQPYIFLPQAFGPFNKARHNKYMAKILERATWLFARDEVSLATLQQVSQTLSNSQDNMSLSPDMTILLDVSHVQLTRELPDNFVTVVPNSKMYQGKSEGAKLQYLTFLTSAIGQIWSLQLTPVLLNHEGEKDHLLCQQLLAMCEQPPWYINDAAALEVKKILGLARFNISSRFHGCVSSLSQSVPTLATSWGHKYEQLFEQFGCRDNIVDITEIELLFTKIEQLVDLDEQLRQQLSSRCEQQKTQVAAMWQQVFALINHEQRS